MKRDERRSRKERTTDLFSFKDEHPGRDNSHVCDATTMATGLDGRQAAGRQVELASVRANSSTV